MSSSSLPLPPGTEPRADAAAPLLDQSLDALPVAFLDFETTGLSAASGDRICEVAVLRVEPGRKRPRKLSQLVQPGIPMPELAQSIHHISDEMLADAPSFSTVHPRLSALLSGAVVVAHNARFDIGFLQMECHRAGLPLPAYGPVVCSLNLARNLFGLNQCSLRALAQRLAITQPNAHRALADCKTTREVFAHMVDSRRDAAGHAPTPRDLLQQADRLKKGGEGRLEMERRLAQAAHDQETVTIEYTARAGTGPLVNRRAITVHNVRLPYIDALCHLRNDERVFHMRRILHVETAAHV